MELNELQELLSTPEELIKSIKGNKEEKSTEALKQYEPEGHAVLDPSKRPDKRVRRATGEIDSNGKEVHAPAIEPVARIPIALQKLIVSRAAGFLVGSPITFNATPANEAEQKMLQMVTKTWQDNKLDYKTKQLAKYMMRETECTELWYLEETNPAYWGALGGPSTQFKMRMKVLAPSKGDGLYPVYNNMGDMLAFARGYRVELAGKGVEKLDVYTADVIYKYTKDTTGWFMESSSNNGLGKIPVIYYAQSKPEWADVQWAIERLETLLSNFADTNDYFSSPMFVFKGEVLGFASKGESGKVLQLEGKDAEVRYLTWEHAPDAIKLEIETLLDIIYTVSQTPNISFKEMKGLGQTSGVARRLMFMDANLKAKDKQDDIFGECIQRRINLQKAAMAKIHTAIEGAVVMDITPVFSVFNPDNELDMIDNLLQATGGKALLSQRTAIALNPLVKDAKTELDQLLKERDALGAQFA